jgi:hypothetical protein
MSSQEKQNMRKGKSMKMKITKSLFWMLLLGMIVSGMSKEASASGGPQPPLPWVTGAQAQVVK